MVIYFADTIQHPCFIFFKLKVAFELNSSNGDKSNCVTFFFLRSTMMNNFLVGGNASASSSFNSLHSSYTTTDINEAFFWFNVGLGIIDVFLFFICTFLFFLRLYKGVKEWTLGFLCVQLVVRCVCFVFSFVALLLRYSDGVRYLYPHIRHLLELYRTLLQVFFTVWRGSYC